MKNEVIGQVSGGELKGEKSAARKSEASGVKLNYCGKNGHAYYHDGRG